MELYDTDKWQRLFGDVSPFRIFIFVEKWKMYALFPF